MNQTEQIKLLRDAWDKYRDEKDLSVDSAFLFAAGFIAATSSISPPAASESVDTPEFEALAIAYRETEYVSDHYRDIIAHINAWHAANKPAALAAQGDAVPVDVEALKDLCRDLYASRPSRVYARRLEQILAHPSPTPAPVTGEKVASIGDDPHFSHLMGAYLDARLRNKLGSDVSKEWAAVCKHIDAHTAAQVAASKPAESGEAVRSLLLQVLQDNLIEECEYNSVEFDAIFGRKSEVDLANEILKRTTPPQPAHPQGAAGLTETQQIELIEPSSSSPVVSGEARLTCKGKGGDYIVVGVAIGAGVSRGNLVHVYRDSQSDILFYRTPMDFAERMEILATPPATTEPVLTDEQIDEIIASAQARGTGHDMDRQIVLNTIAALREQSDQGKGKANG